jgi:hypothetical protein
MTQVLPKSARRTPRAKPYLGLLLLIPALAAAWYGWRAYHDVPAGGQVQAVQITTKQGFVGQAAEAVDNVKPESPDLYIQVFLHQGKKIVMPAYKDTPIGNGLIWKLGTPLDLHNVDRVEVWDHNAVWKDKEFDRISLNDNWEAEGQRFHVTLMGEKITAPDWAMPTMIAGAAVGLLVVLKFVWDQVV